MNAHPERLVAELPCSGDAAGALRYAANKAGKSYMYGTQLERIADAAGRLDTVMAELTEDQQRMVGSALIIASFGSEAVETLAAIEGATHEA